MIYACQTVLFFSGGEENTGKKRKCWFPVEKRENVGFQHFFFLLKCFQKASFSGYVMGLFEKELNYELS